MSRPGGMNILLGEPAQLHWIFKIRRANALSWILRMKPQQNHPTYAFSYRDVDWVELAKPNIKRFSMPIQRIPDLDQPPAKAAIG